MKTIAISVQKGGSGKTTTAVNLAAALAARGQRVLLIDNDPQSSLSLYCNLMHEEKTITDVYRGAAAIREIIKKWHGIDVAPADILLSQIESEITGRKDRRDILRKAISCMNPTHDFCIIDTAPGLGLLTVNALLAADHVIIPVEPNPADIWGLELFFDTLNQIRRAKPGLTYKILLTSFNDRLKLHRQALDAITARSLDTYPVTVARNVRTSEAWGAHEPLLTYDPGNKNNLTYQSIAEMEITQ